VLEIGKELNCLGTSDIVALYVTGLSFAYMHNQGCN
jgi:hypothetical protein